MSHHKPVDPDRRFFLGAAVTVLLGSGLTAALATFMTSLRMTERTKANSGPVVVDLEHLTPGQQMTIVWQGKPIWIIRRTQAMLNGLKHDTDSLRDPESKVDQQPPYATNWYRSIHPEYLVLVGVCTHLGCTPLYQAKGFEPASCAFYCPCHGSCFDFAGRVFKRVPAPINLEVPPYRFISQHVIEVGSHHEA